MKSQVIEILFKKTLNKEKRMQIKWFEIYNLFKNFIIFYI
jgi:hypothetical protein